MMGSTEVTIKSLKKPLLSLYLSKNSPYFKNKFIALFEYMMDLLKIPHQNFTFLVVFLCFTH